MYTKNLNIAQLNQGRNTYAAMHQLYDTIQNKQKNLISIKKNVTDFLHIISPLLLVYKPKKILYFFLCSCFLFCFVFLQCAAPNKWNKAIKVSLSLRYVIRAIYEKSYNNNKKMDQYTPVYDEFSFVKTKLLNVQCLSKHFQ